MQKEIEVKAKIKDKEALLKKLTELDCELSEPVVQKDQVFLQEGISYENYKAGDIFIRIREESGKVIFTLKKSDKNELDNVEKETVIDDAQEMIEALECMGYYEALIVEKERRQGSCQDYEVCIDRVSGLGDFIELEKKSDEDSLKVQEEMFTFLSSLGIKKEDQIMKCYDTLLYEKSKKE